MTGRYAGVVSVAWVSGTRQDIVNPIFIVRLRWAGSGYFIVDITTLQAAKQFPMLVRSLSGLLPKKTEVLNVLVVTEDDQARCIPVKD